MSYAEAAIAGLAVGGPVPSGGRPFEHHNTLNAVYPDTISYQLLLHVSPKNVTDAIKIKYPTARFFVQASRSVSKQVAIHFASTVITSTSVILSGCPIVGKSSSAGASEDTFTIPNKQLSLQPRYLPTKAEAAFLQILNVYNVAPLSSDDEVRAVFKTALLPYGTIIEAIPHTDPTNPNCYDGLWRIVLKLCGHIQTCPERLPFPYRDTVIDFPVRLDTRASQCGCLYCHAPLHSRPACKVAPECRWCYQRWCYQRSHHSAACRSSTAQEARERYLRRRESPQSAPQPEQPTPAILAPTQAQTPSRESPLAVVNATPIPAPPATASE
ncbi:hypothetical protein V1514DRAFT_357363 [Lipomyces japonicus]|uniref:uncharacterized protein n=1 Tax=Lipomyces japonicus TaxID=56871 RepID=UPI0034CFC93E